MTFTQNGIQIGPVLIGGFALVVVLAVLVGVTITGLRARRAHKDITIVLDLGTAALVCGLIFGRLFYIVMPPPSAAPYYTQAWYLAHPLDLLAGPVAVWNGGLGQAGVLVGALLGGLAVLSFRRTDLWEWADLCLPGSLVAAAILPLANLVSGQMLGPATSLPWGVAAAGTQTPDLRYHPVPLYLTLWVALALAGAILARRRAGQGWPPGLWALVGWMALLPGLFLADTLHADVPRPLLGLSGLQIVCFLIEAALISLYLRRNKHPSDDVTNFTEN